MSWIVIYTKPLQEFRAKENLENLGLEVYLPLRLTEKVVSGAFVIDSEPLFPRYIFARNDGFVFQKMMHMLRSTRGVSHVVKFGGRFSELNQETVNQLLIVEEKFSSAPSKKYQQGDKVAFTYGAFTNIEAVFKESDGTSRVILLFDLLNKPTTISVPLNKVKQMS